MPTIENTLVQIKGNDGQVTSGSLQTTYYDHSECVKRAVIRLLIFWAATVLALITFIPLVHLILAAGLFVAGPWIAYRTFKLKYVRNHIQGECPVCREKMEIKMEARDELPRWTYCPRCSNPIQILTKD